MNNEQQDREAFGAWVFDYMKRQYSFYDEATIRAMIVFRKSPVSCLEAAWQVRTPEIEALRAEIAEQCRIIGASGERELALMAKIDSQKRIIEQLAKALATAGRYYTRKSNPPTPAYILDALKAAQPYIAQTDAIKADDAYTIGSNRYEIEPIGSKAKDE